MRLEDFMMAMAVLIVTAILAGWSYIALPDLANALQSHEGWVLVQGAKESDEQLTASVPINTKYGSHSSSTVGSYFLRYSYPYGGKFFYAEWHHLLRADTVFNRFNSLTHGQIVPVYVNPHNPAESDLFNSLKWADLKMVEVLFDFFYFVTVIFYFYGAYVFVGFTYFDKPLPSKRKKAEHEDKPIENRESRRHKKHRKE